MPGQISDKFDQLGCVVLIPTYNNAATLASVIEEVLLFTSNIIVINDGSTDETKSIIQRFDSIQSIGFSQNRGKGQALRAGFKEAFNQGFKYAISIDSDAQHKAEDLPSFLNAVEDEGEQLLIGARDLSQPNVPESNLFANKFSNFWFWVCTGLKAEDSQSGYRLYPLKTLNEMRLFTSRYEFEIEVMVRLAWKMVPIRFISIDVVYPPIEERVSHFRKGPDFSRISLLNCVLVPLGLFVFRPLIFIRSFDSQKVKTFIKEQIVYNTGSDKIVITTVWLGLFIGLSPFWGFKLLTVAILAFGFKLNKPLILGTSYIGMPPFIPFIIWSSHQVGGWVLKKPNLILSPSQIELSSAFVYENLLQQLIGGTVFALVLATALSAVIYVIMRLLRNRKATLKA